MRFIVLIAGLFIAGFCAAQSPLYRLGSTSGAEKKTAQIIQRTASEGMYEIESLVYVTNEQPYFNPSIYGDGNALMKRALVSAWPEFGEIEVVSQAQFEAEKGSKNTHYIFLEKSTSTSRSATQSSISYLTDTVHYLFLVNKNGDPVQSCWLDQINFLKSDVLFHTAVKLLQSEMKRKVSFYSEDHRDYSKAAADFDQLQIEKIKEKTLFVPRENLNKKLDEATVAEAYGGDVKVISLEESYEKMLGDSDCYIAIGGVYNHVQAGVKQKVYDVQKMVLNPYTGAIVAFGKAETYGGNQGFKKKDFENLANGKSLTK